MRPYRPPAPATVTSVASIATAVLSALLAPGAAVHAAESVRSVPAFIAISSKGAFSVTVEVGPAQSVRVSGDEAVVAAVKTEVVDKELLITIPEKTYKSSHDGPRVVITMPSLSRVKVEGAGETLLNKVSGDRLDISYLGAGHLQANGKVKYLRLAAKGVGEVDTRGLVADRVDVNFEGVGAVSVTARDLLNAVARGMGSLTYYGHPRTINKSVSGIGSVNAGD